MAYSYIEYVGDGSTDSFSIPFPYMNSAEVSVFVDGVEDTGATFLSSGLIQTSSAPATNAVVRVARSTNITSRAVDFSSGSVLTEEDLDQSNIQVFYATQEAIDTAGEAIFKTADGKFDAQNRVIKNVADPVDANDAVNKDWAESGMSSQLAQATAQATNASNSASSALSSANTATTQAGIATTKASEASSSAASALSSKNAASASETAAAASASTATTQANTATTKAGEASASATSASNSASAATTQANVATSAASTATTQATSATNSANSASASATTATTKAGEASTSATSAAQSAAEAQGYRDTTLGYRDSAAASASSALAIYGSTTDVENAVNAAATSATNSATSASQASSSATSASSSASSAATSATNAANSATSAAASETSAEGHKDLAYTYWQNAASAVAYQDLAAIAASKAVTAVDVFVYDTSKDSDGGAWRKRTQGTSWYNETLNTSTRGARKEFPAVAVVVLTSSSVTIYDGDDPSLPMWRVIDLYGGSATRTTIAMLNGVLCVGDALGSTAGGLWAVNLIKEQCDHYTTAGSSNLGTNYNTIDPNALPVQARNTVGGIVNYAVNDVAMTVLPNAPIDSATGLPVPTIAVATSGGVSVIKDDGSVVDSVPVTDNTPSVHSINWDTDKFVALIYTSPNGRGAVATYTGEGTLINLFSSYNVEKSQYVGTEILSPNVYFYGSDAGMHLANSTEYANGVINNYYYSGGWKHDGITFTDYDDANPTEGMSARVTSDYNTGWQHGDIKGTFLSDTTVETVGVDESTELVTNGVSPMSTTTGWYEPRNLCTLSVVDGAIRATSDDTSTFGVATQITTVVGEVYTVTINVNRGNTSSGQTYLRASETRQNLDSDFLVNTFSAYTEDQDYTFTFKATTTTLYLGLITTGHSAGEYVEINSASVKQTGNLVVNGTFDVDTSGWTSNVANVDLTVSSNALVITNNTGGSQDSRAISSGFTTVVGKTYLLTGDIVAKAGYAGTIALNVGNGPGYSTITSVTGDTGDSLSKTFVATSTTTYFFSAATIADTASYTIDNISVRLAESDRSVNNNGLEVHGEIVKSAVATGADLVAYSGFSSNNYLEQPYNSDLDFGTGDFYVMGWVKTSSASATTLISMADDRTQPTPVGGLHIYVNTNDIAVRVSGHSYTTTNDAIPTSTWVYAAVTRNSGTANLYLNGKFITSWSASTSFSLDPALTRLSIGKGAYSVNNKELALWRIGAGAPTAEQIAKIYEDEKVLFQEGAQATLYGTSDAVTALAYDDTTELLHVGTSSGRSVFSGLRRVDNTTDAVGTAISASNGMVVEE